MVCAGLPAHTQPVRGPAHAIRPAQTNRGFGVQAAMRLLLLLLLLSRLHGSRLPVHQVLPRAPLMQLLLHIACLPVYPCSHLLDPFPALPDSATCCHMPHCHSSTNSSYLAGHAPLPADCASYYTAVHPLCAQPPSRPPTHPGPPPPAPLTSKPYCSARGSAPTALHTL